MAEREPRRRQGRKEKEGQRPHQRSSATGLFFAVAAEESESESESEAGSVERRGEERTKGTGATEEEEAAVMPASLC